MVALREEVQQQLGTAVTLEETDEERVGLTFDESAVGESQSNGVAENAVQQIQGHSRVLRDGVEERYQKKVTGDHPCMPRLVRHAAGVKARLQVCEDGRTGYERLRGKTFKGEWLEFAECVWGTFGPNQKGVQTRSSLVHRYLVGLP